jgi:hypothetical protein
LDTTSRTGSASFYGILALALPFLSVALFIVVSIPLVRADGALDVGDALHQYYVVLYGAIGWVIVALLGVWAIIISKRRNEPAKFVRTLAWVANSLLFLFALSFLVVSVVLQW